MIPFFFCFLFVLLGFFSYMIIKIVTFFIAFWSTTVYTVIKIIFIMIVLISFIFFFSFISFFFSTVCNIEIHYRYCFHYMWFVFYSAAFFFLLQKILVVFYSDILSQWWAVYLLVFLIFSLISHFLMLTFGILFLLIELVLHNH